MALSDSYVVTGPFRDKRTEEVWNFVANREQWLFCSWPFWASIKPPEDVSLNACCGPRVSGEKSILGQSGAFWRASVKPAARKRPRCSAKRSERYRRRRYQDVTVLDLDGTHRPVRVLTRFVKLDAELQRQSGGRRHGGLMGGRPSIRLPQQRLGRPVALDQGHAPCFGHLDGTLGEGGTLRPRPRRKPTSPSSMSRATRSVVVSGSLPSSYMTSSIS